MHQRALAPLLVGRQSQLAELHEHLARARSGAGHVLLLAGEAGVGKTRLLREFTRALPPEVRVLTGHCYDEHPAPAYGPFAELLDRLDEAATPALADLRRMLPALAPDSDAAPDPQAERRRLFHAIHQALRPAEGVTHLLVLEDLHWSDQATQDLLLSLARAIEDDRVLIVGTFRTDEMHRLHPMAALIARLARDRRYHELRLAPLSRDELAELLAATLGQHPQPDLLAALYERTEGNPFFAEEVLEALLAGGPPALATAQQLGAGAIPLSIKDSILRRVADLDEDTTAIVRAAAVIGRSFDFELLRRLSGQPEATLMRALAALVERQLIGEEPGDPEDHYRFRHELIRAALYEEMLRRERRLRHHEVLRALEELHAANLAPVIDRLAYHALQARALPEAARYSRMAAERAARVHAYREAIGHYEAALESGEQAGALDERERADLLTRLGTCAFQIGDPRRAADFWREALPAYEALGERRRAADLLRWLGRSAWDVGQAAEAFRLTHAALAKLEGEAGCRELAMACSALSHLHMFQISERGPDAAEQCIVWGERALAMAEALGDEDVITHALNNIGVAYTDSGRPAEGIAHLERSLAIALKADLPADAVRAYINLGSKLTQVGRAPEGLALQREGFAYAARHGYIRGSGKLLYSICYSLFMSGAWDELEAELATALRAGFTAAHEVRPQLQLYHAMLLLDRGQLVDARAQLLQVRQAVKDEAEVCLMVDQLLILAHLELGELREALDRADRLLADLLGRLGPDATVADLGPSCFKLGANVEIYLATGRLDDATAIVVALEAIVAQNRETPLHKAMVAELRALLTLQSDPARAAEQFLVAGTQFEAIGCRPYFVQSRRRYAEALLRSGIAANRPLAAAALRAARADAEALRYVAELRQIEALERQLAPQLRASLGMVERSAASAPRAPDGLTPRELEVLTLISRGLSNRAIAAALVISEKTAEVHVRNILGKLGFSSRTQAATYAVERGITARSA